jgi:hypothetical protein
MGLFKRSKSEPEWLDVGDLGEDFQGELEEQAESYLQAKGNRGSLACMIGEYKPGGWGNTTEELHRWVLQSVPPMYNQMAQEQIKAIEKGKVCFIVGRVSGSSQLAGCRCVGVVCMT